MTINVRCGVASRSGDPAAVAAPNASALPEPITEATWARFFDPAEPVHAFVAERGDAVVGLVHFLYHRSTTRLSDVCYLQDLYRAMTCEASASVDG